MNNYLTQLKTKTPDIFYAVILIITFIQSIFFVLLARTPLKKLILSSLTGFLLIYYVAELNGLALIFFYYLVSIIILKSMADKSVAIPLVIGLTFIFMTLTRLEIFFFFTFEKFINVLNMLVSLRAISFNIDVIKNKSKLTFQPTQYDHKNYIFHSINYFDFLGYLLSFCGVFTGPFYTFKTYYDMVYLIDGREITKNDENKYSTSGRDIDTCLSYLKQVFVKILISVVTLLVCTKLVNLTDLKNGYSDLINPNIIYFGWMQLSPFFCRLTITLIYVLLMKNRFYSCWLLSEAACVTVGLGAYPEILNPKIGDGPTQSHSNFSPEQIAESKINYQTITSVKIASLELSNELNHVVRNWNPSVQYFMGVYIFKIIPNKNFKYLGTFFLSALWHGIYPGYFMSFITIALICHAEKSLKSFFKNFIPLPHYKSYTIADNISIIRQKTETTSTIDKTTSTTSTDTSHTCSCNFSYTYLIGYKIVAILYYIFIQRTLEYAITPFIILYRIDENIQIWKELYFFGHCYIILGILISVVDLGRRAVFKKPNRSINHQKTL